MHRKLHLILKTAREKNIPSVLSLRCLGLQPMLHVKCTILHDYYERTVSFLLFFNDLGTALAYTLLNVVLRYNMDLLTREFVSICKQWSFYALNAWHERWLKPWKREAFHNVYIFIIFLYFFYLDFNPLMMPGLLRSLTLELLRFRDHAMHGACISFMLSKHVGRHYCFLSCKSWEALSCFWERCNVFFFIWHVMQSNWLSNSLLPELSYPSLRGISWLSLYLLCNAPFQVITRISYNNFKLSPVQWKVKHMTE